MGPEGVEGTDDSTHQSGSVAAIKTRSTNVLCICGLILGVAAMFCTWTYVSSPDYIATWFFSPTYRTASDLIPVGV